MAILSNLVVHGASRFLNTAYFNDVSISGTASLASLSLSGTLAVTGATTLSGALNVSGATSLAGLNVSGTATFSKTTDLSGTANNGPALIVGGAVGSAHIEIDANEIQQKASGTTTGNLYINNDGGIVYLSGQSVYANGSTFVAPTTNVVTLNSTNVNVSNNLHATHFDLQTVAQLGGSFYVSPTLKFPNSGTKLAVSKSSTALTLTIKDSSISTSIMAGIAWTVNSAVKVSGTINGVVTGTMDGTITGITNGSQMVVQVSGGNWNSVAATSTDLTASQFSDLTVMVYQRRVVNGSNNYDYRVGIWMNCYDLTNSSATIRIYGGTKSTPNVMLGNLYGMTFNGKTIGTQIGTQDTWGILTSMGYFEGAIVSTEGQIGGWTIGDTKLYNNTDSMTSTSAGIYLGTNGIRNYKDANTFVNITGGVITAKAVDLTGKITATSGSIGGWTIGTSSMYTNNHTAWNTNSNGLYLSANGIAGGKQGIWYLWNDGSAKIGALTLSAAGVLSVPAANITGTLTASQIGAGAITADKLAANTLHIGAHNLLKSSYLQKMNSTDYNIANVYLVARDKPIAGEIVTLQIKGTLAATKTSWGIYNSGGSIQMTTLNSSNYDSETGIYTKTFEWKVTTGSTTAANTHISIYTLNNNQSGSSSIEWVMLERGNQPSGWGLSADEIGGFNITNNSINSGTYGSDNSVYISTANMSAKSIGGSASTVNTWRFTIGSKFGVTSDGSVYASALTMGTSSGYHAFVSSNGLDIYNDTTLLSSFGTTIQIGASTGNNIQINSNGITMRRSSSFRIPEIFCIGVESRTANAGTIDNPSATEVTTAPYYILGQSGYDSTTTQPGAYSFQSGSVSYATGQYSTAMGHNCIASGSYAFAVGNTSQATNYASVAIGDTVLSSGICSYAEGSNTTASGSDSHAEGAGTTASEWASHAEGKDTTASGRYSHAEGNGTVASEEKAHAEGSETTASGLASHAEGSNTIASGVDSHAEGSGTIASGWGSHASGDDTIASGTYQTVIGRCNAVTTTVSNGTTVYDAGDYAFIVGNGNSNSSRRNALTLDWDGNLVTDGSISTKYGGLIIYNENDKYGNIVSSAFTANRTFTLPNATGTIALTSSNITGTAGNVTGTVTVGHGGTGATSFTANSVIMSGSSTTAALTTRSVTNNTSASAITANTNIITANTLAYWNGAYSGTTSRLAYCNKGAFGTMATKSASDYAALSGATFTGGISGTTGTFSDVVTAANIGNIQSASKSVAITSSNTIGATPAIGAQLTLTPGTYLLWGRFVFSTSGSGTSRNNRIAFYTGASPTDSTMLTESQVCVYTAARNWGALTTTYIVSPTANTTYTVGGTSSLPGPDGGMSVIKAIRLL